MTRYLRLAAVILLLAPLAGCGSLLQLLNLNRVTVRLVNDTDFPLTVELYVGDDQNTLESVLTSTGERITLTISARQTGTFDRDCDALQAIVISDADLSYILGVGPSQSTRVYRDGSDFNCGDTLTFTFTNPNLTTLSISFSR